MPDAQITSLLSWYNFFEKEIQTNEKLMNYMKYTDQFPMFSWDKSNLIRFMGTEYTKVMYTSDEPINTTTLEKFFQSFLMCGSISDGMKQKLLFPCQS